jgi:hypothetical protein
MLSDINTFEEFDHEAVKTIVKELNEEINISEEDSDLIAYFPEDLGDLEIIAKTIQGINPGDTRQLINYSCWMVAESINTKKLKATSLELLADSINIVSLEGETVTIKGKHVSVGRKLGVTGIGRIESSESLKIGSIYSENLSIEHLSTSEVQIGSLNGNASISSKGNVILDSIEGNVSIVSPSMYVACRALAN